MRRALSIILYIVAGFFVYTVCLLAFVNQPAAPKCALAAGFTALGLFFLCLGLAVSGLQNWKRDTGVVLLSGAGFTLFLIFTFVCLLMTDEFRQMMKPDTLTFFSAYSSGGAFMLSTAALGTLLLLAGISEGHPSVSDEA